MMNGIEQLECKCGDYRNCLRCSTTFHIMASNLKQAELDLCHFMAVDSTLYKFDDPIRCTGCGTDQLVGMALLPNKRFCCRDCFCPKHNGVKTRQGFGYGHCVDCEYLKSVQEKIGADPILTYRHGEFTCNSLPSLEGTPPTPADEEGFARCVDCDVKIPVELIGMIFDNSQVLPNGKVCCETCYKSRGSLVV